MQSKDNRLLDILYFVAALVGGVLVYELSFLGGLASFVVLAFTVPDPASLAYYETVTSATFLMYVIIVSALISLAATNGAYKRMMSLFLIIAAAFWLIHDALPLGIWTPLGLAVIAALPLYQILVRRTRH